MATVYTPTDREGVRSYAAKGGVRYEAQWRDNAGRIKTKGGFRLKNDAANYRKSMMGAAVDGRPTEVSKTTMAEWWETYAAGKTWKANTRQTNECNAAHVLAAMGHVRVVDVRPSHVRAMVKALADDGKSVEVQNKARTLVSSLCLAAINDRMAGMGPNPCNGVKQTKPTRKIPRALTVEQVTKLTALLPSWCHLHVETLAYAGLRPEELAGLRREDMTVTDDGRVIAHVWRVTTETSGVLEDDDKTKTHAERDVDFSGLSAEALDKLRDRLKHMTPKARVFTGPLGGTFRRTKLGTAMREAVRAYNALPAEERDVELPTIKNVTPYDLRHTCATILARSGVSQTTAAKFMGHDPAIFAKTYAEVFASDLTVAADAIAAARKAVGQ